MEVRALWVATIVAGILVLLILIAFGFQPIFHHRIHQASQSDHTFPSPAVISDERAQRLALQSAQRRQLDGAHGRMPIESAMKAIAAKGDRAFDPVEGTP